MKRTNCESLAGAARSHSGAGISRSAPKSIVLMILLTAGAAAQISNPDLPSASSIMGFETPFGWIMNAKASSTTVRTQGGVALELLASGNATLTSLPVASTTPALAGAGQTGAIFEVDVMLPPQNGGNTGSLKLFVNSPSAKLNSALVGQVNFSAYRPGIYNTLKFPIPAEMGSSLGSGAFSDLTFTFQLNAPGSAPAAYLFDNLRVHSVAVKARGTLQRPTGYSDSVDLPANASGTQQRRAGYGGSVDLSVTGSTPVTQLFTIGPVQVPASFQLESGSTGRTTVELALGHDGTALVTCNYGPNSSDQTLTSYIFTSCTTGFEPGDLVAVNWAKIEIVGGTAPMQLLAQLAQNPIADLVGGGIIPAMPTFWGSYNNCVPAPVTSTVTAMSASCANQTAQANQIVTNYFKEVANANIGADSIATPTPISARRLGDGLPPALQAQPDALQARTASSANQTLGNQTLGPWQGHMCNGCNWDAYYDVYGNFSAAATTSGPNYQDNAALSATLTAGVVLWGTNVNVLTVDLDADGSLGSGTFSTCPNTDPSTAASGTAEVCVKSYLFGTQVYQQSWSSLSGSTSLASFSKTYNLPAMNIWIFDINMGATVSAGVNAGATIAGSSLDLTLTPYASLGATIAGGVDVLIASGNVSATVNMLDVRTPLTAQATWVTNTAPQSCSATVQGSLLAQLTASSGGGEVDLDAQFLWYSQSMTLFDWAPLASTTKTLLSTPIASQSFELPIALCQQPLSVTIGAPVASGLLATNVSYALAGTANTGSIKCDTPNTTFTWSSSNPHDTIGGSGCGARVTFADPGSRKLTLTVVDNITDTFGTKIPETGSASVTLTALPVITLPTTGSGALIRPAH